MRKGPKPFSFGPALTLISGDGRRAGRHHEDAGRHRHAGHHEDRRGRHGTAMAAVVPAMPAFSAAPAIAFALGIAAPIPARALPAVGIPAIIMSAEDEGARRYIGGNTQRVLRLRHRHDAQCSEETPNRQ